MLCTVSQYKGMTSNCSTSKQYIVRLGPYCLQTVGGPSQVLGSPSHSTRVVVAWLSVDDPNQLKP